jgi:hypothetical protein
VLLERFDTWACESPRCEDMRVAEPTIHATPPSCKRLRAVVPVAAGRLAINRVTGQVQFHYPICAITAPISHLRNTRFSGCLAFR